MCIIPELKHSALTQSQYQRVGISCLYLIIEQKAPPITLCEINMARLRFPGRPGCRFDRLGVRYGADEARNANDPLTLFVANIHRGLRAFRELVGDSDEVIPNFFTASSQDGRHRSFLR